MRNWGFLMNSNDTTKKLPLWKDRKIDDNREPISDEELASRVKKFHEDTLKLTNEIEVFLKNNENKG